jgi:hypothetical protein
VAPALVLEEPLVWLVEHLDEPGQADILHAVGEWGGRRSAVAIVTRLEHRNGWRSPELQANAILALETLAGEASVRELTRLATSGSDADGRLALDGIEAIASVGSTEVAEGGAMPNSPTAEALWNAYHELLAETPIGHVVVSLEEAAADRPTLARRLLTVRASVLTAIETEFNAFLSRSRHPVRSAPAFEIVSVRSWFDADEGQVRPAEVY